MLHCFLSKEEWLEQTYGDESDEWWDYIAEDGPGETCTLPDGHEGAHEFVRNDQIETVFRDAEGE